MHVFQPRVPLNRQLVPRSIWPVPASVRSWLPALAVLALHVVVSSCWLPSALAADSRPNILFIFTDDHAAHAMSCYGSRINETPNLDRIAEGGMRFDRCYCTNSLCGPSRAVILTGKHSHLNGFRRNGDRFDGGQQTFPKLLRQAGYQTAIVGKWHLGTDPTGFDNWQVLIGQGPYYNPTMIENGERVKHTGYTTDIITDMALETLKNRDPDKPFLLMFQHKAPHREWQPSPKHLTLYDDVTIPEPDNLFDDYSGRGTAARTQEMTVARHMRLNQDLKLTPPRNLTQEQLRAWNAAYEPKNRAFREAKLTGKDLVRWQYQRYIKDYLRCVASVDDNVGRVLDYLDESGLADNTLVIYSSDQGFFLGDHGWYDKRFMYEEAYRMPLLVRWPGVIKPGSVSTDLVSNLDFAETLLDAAGVTIPADMQGRSLVPLLEGKPAGTQQDSLYYHYYEFPAVHMVRRHYGIRTARYKLIHFYNIDEWELYDLQRDPHEMRSVYGEDDYAPQVKELKRRLAELQLQYQVPDDHGSVPKVVPPRKPGRKPPRKPQPKPKS